ncbi:hypothetical protein SNL152K_10409 [Streptomyces sp. NL15-2K]|nr:hypothetical protein SNL152K_10409 [Streptomyces sp. NL15-2K]
MKAAGRSVRARLRDGVAASDPGLLRLAAGLRTVGAIALTLAVLGLVGADVPHLVTGAMAAMVATFAIREKQRGQQAVTLALGLPVALASVTLGALLSSRVVAGDLFFVALIFCAVYGRRFGDRGTALGLIGFQVYFLSLFVGATVSGLPELYGAIGVAFPVSALARFALVPETPAHILERLREAFRARLAQLVSAQLDLLDAGPDEVDKALEDVRDGTARLHETAMMIQGRLEEGTADEATARLVQRRVADAEIAAERLGLVAADRAQRRAGGHTDPASAGRARPGRRPAAGPRRGDRHVAPRSPGAAHARAAARHRRHRHGPVPCAQPAPRIPRRGQPAARRTPRPGRLPGRRRGRPRGAGAADRPRRGPGRVGRLARDGPFPRGTRRRGRRDRRRRGREPAGRGAHGAAAADHPRGSAGRRRVLARHGRR